MLNCGLQQGPTSSRLLWAKPPAFAHLLFFTDALRKGVRLVFCVDVSFRPCNPGRMSPCKSMSGLASVPSSCTEATQTERVRRQLCLLSAPSKGFLVRSEPHLVPVFCFDARSRRIE